MVDESFDYGCRRSAQPRRALSELHAVVIERNCPNRHYRSIGIQCHLPTEGDVRVEVLGPDGCVLDVLVDGKLSAGDHLQSWQANERAPGVYAYRILFEGMSKMGAILLRA